MNEAAKMMIIGKKESYMIRVLLQKLSAEGIDAFFSEEQIDKISQSIRETSVIICYMDTNEPLPTDVMTYLKDQMIERGIHIALIGEKPELDKTVPHFPDDLLIEAFQRPIEYDRFVKVISSHAQKAASGELKKSILVVDDDSTFLGLVREWLRDTYKILIANSGMQAIKLLSKQKVDLILLDHEMPVTSGPQVLRMLRSDEDTKNIPVIFLTGKSDRESVMEVMDLKPEGYLLKNIGKEEVLRKLEEYFLSR